MTKIKGFVQAVSSLVGVLSVAACGTYVPHIEELYEANKAEESASIITAGGQLEYDVKKKVYCELIDALKNLQPGQLPTDWAAEVTLDLQVDETGAVNPGVSWIDPMAKAQSLTLGFGATASSQATTEDKFNSYWELSRLQTIANDICPNYKAIQGSSLLIQSRLDLQNWLNDALLINGLMPSSQIGKNAAESFKQDTISRHVKFIVITSGSVTPTWKLVRVATGNGSLPLASANRTRTHDLLITLGQKFKAGSPNILLSSHNAQENGIAVSNGNRSTLAPLFPQ